MPYREEHVEAYHAWMEDEALREATASERLSLVEEHEMQRSWHDDHTKVRGGVGWGGGASGAVGRKQARETRGGKVWWV